MGCTMTAAISMAVANGLGSPQSSLSNYQVIELEKVFCHSAFLTVSDHGLGCENSSLMNKNATNIQVVWLCITATLHSGSLPHKTDHAYLSSRTFTRVAFRSYEYSTRSFHYSLVSWCWVCDCLPVQATLTVGLHFREMLQHSKFSFRCTDLWILTYRQAAFWIANGACDILTDVIIVLLPLYLVWSLQMPWRKKGVVTIAFGSRVL